LRETTRVERDRYDDLRTEAAPTAGVAQEATERPGEVRTVLVLETLNRARESATILPERRRIAGALVAFNAR
jgi:hypothetical protein